MKRLPKAELYKTIFQTRYKPKLKFYELLYPAAQKFDKYPHWLTDRLKVVLKDYEKHCSLAIQHRSFAYDQDSKDFSLATSNIEQAINILPESLQLDNFERLGFRQKYLAKTEILFADLVKILNIKLLGQEKRLEEILPGEVNDLMYRIDLKKEPYLYHLTLGPVKKPEIPANMEFNQEYHLHPETRNQDYLEIINKYPEVAIFFDIDFYQESEKIPIDKISDFFETAVNEINDVIDNFIQYLFD